jgi:hypothetical protein
MKIVVYLTLIILILSLVVTKRSKGKSKKGILVGRLSGTPQGPGSAVLVPRPIAVARPVVLSRPMVVRRFAIVRSSVNECPDTHNFQGLVDSELGDCKEPCTRRTCIQTSERCCYYTAAMARRRVLLK